MSIEILKLKFKPYEHWYFYGYALSSREIIPKPKAMQKNALSRMRVFTKIKVLFSRTKNKKGGIKDGK
jgi:hypothetical protein